MSGYPARDEAARQILDIGSRLVAGGYVVANDGNISCLIGADRVLATPTGVSKSRMTPEMLSVLDLGGGVLEAGTVPVSSEVKMHLRAYRENSDLRAVVHAHPVVATSFAAAGIALDDSILTESVTAVGSLPVARFAVPGTDQVAESIAPFCTSYNGALLANHGVITWAEKLETAFFRMEWVEMLAKATLITKYIIGQYNTLSEEQTKAFGPIREHLGIRAGGVPVHAAAATNEQNVLPRSGLVPHCREDAPAPMVEDIVRRVTENVLEALGQEKTPARKDVGRS